MAILGLRTWGDPILRSKGAPVVAFDERLATLAADMRETMGVANGVGLAAPQVGVPRRLFVFASSEEAGAYANPTYEPLGEETQEAEEGCLSVPGFYYPVVRAMRVRVRAQQLDGTGVDREAEGFLARIFQHEIDHLDGILFIDRLTPERRKEAMRAMRDHDFGAPLPSRPAARAL